MKAETRAKLKARTQDHVPVKEIFDDLVITKDGRVAMVIQTSAVNFDLLSEYEQENKINAFSGLLNSLNFPLQIIIRTKKVNVNNYLSYLEDNMKKLKSDGARKQMEIYDKFIRNLIAENEVLDKKFYFVFNYVPASLQTKDFLAMLQKEEELPFEKRFVLPKLLEQAKAFLYPKRDQIYKMASRMGLDTKQLENNDLIKLFYEYYN